MYSEIRDFVYFRGFSFVGFLQYWLLFFFVFFFPVLLLFILIHFLCVLYPPWSFIEFFFFNPYLLWEPLNVFNGGCFIIVSLLTSIKRLCIFFENHILAVEFCSFVIFSQFWSFLCNFCLTVFLTTIILSLFMLYSQSCSNDQI